MNNLTEHQDLYKRGKIMVMCIAIYRLLIALVWILFFLLSLPATSTANILHIIFNLAVAFGLFFKKKIAGIVLAAVLVYWELEWLWITIRGFSVFTGESPWEEGAEEIIPFTMDFLHTITISRGVIFISIAAFVVYAMLFSKSVNQYLMTEKK